MKNIKIEDDAHKALSGYCPKSKTYGECIADLLAGEPFTTRLKQVLPRTVERVEANKKGGRVDLSASDDLIRVCQWIVDTCEMRSGKERSK